jgi:predicted nuclease with RNAse H fold
MVYDREAVRMGIRLIPPAQLGFREVTRAMDP